jgi:hypothetical protein
LKDVRIISGIYGVLSVPTQTGVHGLVRGLFPPCYRDVCLQLVRMSAPSKRLLRSSALAQHIHAVLSQICRDGNIMKSASHPELGWSPIPAFTPDFCDYPPQIYRVGRCSSSAATLNPRIQHVIFSIAEEDAI